jgi:hypothetical protein
MAAAGKGGDSKSWEAPRRLHNATCRLPDRPRTDCKAANFCVIAVPLGASSGKYAVDSVC